MYIDKSPAIIKQHWLIFKKRLRSHLQTLEEPLEERFIGNIPDEVGCEIEFTKLGPDLMYRHLGGPRFHLIFNIGSERLVMKPIIGKTHLQYSFYIVDTTKYSRFGKNKNIKRFSYIPYTDNQLNKYLYDMFRYINSHKILN